MFTRKDIVSNVENNNKVLIARSPKALSVQYGEKSGSYAFSALRRYTFTEQGIKRWWAPRLTSTPDAGTGFAASNHGDASAEHEGIEIPVRGAVLVAHAFETMAARLTLPEPGVYFIAARFLAAAPFDGPYIVDVCANGVRLWKDTIVSENSACMFKGFVRMMSSGFVDLATNAEKETQTVPCRTFIEYAIVRCDEQSGAPLLRYDDAVNGFDESTLRHLLAETRFAPVNIGAAQMGNEERAALLQKEWTIRQEYIESQYQCSVQDLAERLMKPAAEATLKYCVFMIPRSGSTLLAELLARTHKLGYPSESFVPDIVRSLSLAFSDTFTSYEDFLVQRLRSNNGVFGIEIESDRFLEEPAFFANVNDWRHVYIWREDILAQAISLQISVDTGVWHNFSSAGGEHEFHYISRDSIIAQMNYLLRVETFFRYYFTEHRLSPYRVSYEALVANPVGEAQRIARHIGVECSEAEFAGNGKIAVQPTSKARNAYYKLLAVAGGGDMWGYDIEQVDGRHMAVLHGVDRSLLDTSAERSPILFLGDDERTVCDKVNRHVMRQISAMPR